MKPKDQILEAALALAVQYGWRFGVTREAVAAQVGCAESLISFYFGNMDDFRTAVMIAAVERKIEVVVAEGVCLRHPVAVAAYDVHVSSRHDN